VVARHAATVRPVDVDDPTPDSDRRGAVLDAMRALPDRQREVLALRYYLDLSEADIADTLGISRGAVKSHASRGSATLRSLLEEEL
jgi:RNA polymerase sigma factor (sigma-70 family)